MSAIVSHEGESTHTSRNAEIDQLADSIAVHAARIDAATHGLLTEIRRFDDLGGWGWQGAKSCVDWLCWRVGLEPVTAAEKVRVARKLGELPLIDAAFAAGELSYCKVRAMARVATAATEARLLEMAQHATGAQLEKICRGFRRVQRAAALDDEARRKAAEPDRYVRQRFMPDGMVRIEVQLLPDEAELVWQALADVRAELVADAKAAADQGAESEVAAAADAVAEEHAASDACPCPQDGLHSAESGAVEGSDMKETAAASQESVEAREPDHPSVEGAPDSAECPVDPSDPLAFLFAPEPDEPRPRGTWARCEQTGELVYYGSDPPDVWPEDDEPSFEDGEAALEERARKQLPSRAEWAARRRGEVLPGLADALVTLAERTLSEPPADRADGKRRARRRGQRPLLLIHLSEDRLAQALAAVDDAPRDEAAPDDDAARGAGASAALPPARPVPFVAELHGGAWLRGETLLRLACDCGVAVVKTDAEGAVLDVGRRRRTIPPAIQRALLVRDGHCQFPGCTADADDTHHIDPWVKGGKTRLDNLHLACKFHHTALHEGGFSVSRAEDGSLSFRDPRGRIIEPAPPAAAAPWGSSGAETALEALAAEQQDGGIVIDRTTSLPHWDGTPPDIAAAVSGLWWRQEHGGGAAGAGGSAGDSA